MVATRSFARRAFAPLALVRVAAAVAALAMVHPDEFFQSQEVMARSVLTETDPALAAQLHVPWEFSLPAPNRSVLFPYLVAGLPYKLLQAIGVPLSGHVLLLVPRLVLCALSFLVDAALFHCATALRAKDPMAAVLSFASSWPALIFLTRPFSNTFETLVLALCMWTLLCFNPRLRIAFKMFHIQTLMLGSLLAVGFFTRFTFPFFFFPLGLELVRRQDALLVQEFEKKHEVPAQTNGKDKESSEVVNDKPEVPAQKRELKKPASMPVFVQQFGKKHEKAGVKKPSPVSRMVKHWEKKCEMPEEEDEETTPPPPVPKLQPPPVPTLPGKKEPWDYTKTTGAMDAELHKAQKRQLFQRRIARAISIGIQGLISFVFVSAGIVALDTWYYHGEFPVTTDAWMNAVIAPLNNLKYNLDPANLELHGTHLRVTHALVNMPMLFGPLFVVFLLSLKTAKQRLWQVSCVLVPLALISLAPHQEPRFLLPLLVPLHLFHGHAIMNARWKQVVWGIFSVALTIFFGVLHQGGLLPLLLSLGSGGSSTLLAVPFTGCRFAEDFVPETNVPIVFYKTYMPPRFTLANADKPWGRDFNVVDLAGGDAMHSQLQAVASHGEFLLVAPASVEIDNVLDVLGTHTADDKPPVVGTCFPHVSTEDLDWEKPLELVIYRWTKPASFVSRLWEATTSVFSS